MTRCSLCLLGLFVVSSMTAVAQEQEVPETIYLKRKPIVLRAPEQFQVPISLEAATEVVLTATSTGPVQAVLCEVGDEVKSQSELIRVDSEEQRLLVDRAKAALTLAKAEGGSEAGAARVAVAELDLKLAQLRLDRTKTVAPFEATAVAVHVVPGEFVQQSTPLVTLIDDATVTATIPVERSAAAPGKTIPVTIEGQPYDAKVKALLPLSEKFEPLRDLFESVATAVVVFDNAGGRLAVGQTVRSELIPRDPVVEVPNDSVATDESGVRRVFVIRKDIAVAVAVQVLGAVGETETFVAGEFAQGDELVTEGADQLVDGRRIVSAADPVASTSTGRQQTRQGGGVSNVRPAGRRVIPDEDDPPKRSVSPGGF